MQTARLIVADSERNADMLYATGLFVPDPFIWFEWRGRTHAVMSDLEIDRAQKRARVDRVLSWSRFQRQLQRDGVKQPRLHDVLRRVLQQSGIRAVEVPSSFPVGLARKLRGVRLKVKPDPFFAERELKTAAEVRHLGAALALAETGMRVAVGALRRARIGRDGFLYHRATRLSSEHVQGLINATIAGLGGAASHTIVAGGSQACDPHETGHGRLRAHQTIIIDIFPRDTATGYWGDITRTVVRGKATDRVWKMYDAVRRAQRLAFEKLCDGADGQDIHRAIHELFRAGGFTTGRRKGRMRGFFHGTGHGLGLDIHEPPRIGPVPATLKAGHVVTVEPGLYEPGRGGVRLEDVAVIGRDGARNLTRFPKILEI
jgi:Xaa-Pro aminopeptidase